MKLLNIDDGWLATWRNHTGASYTHATPCSLSTFCESCASIHALHSNYWSGIEIKKIGANVAALEFMIFWSAQSVWLMYISHKTSEYVFLFIKNIINLFDLHYRLIWWRCVCFQRKNSDRSYSILAHWITENSFFACLEPMRNNYRHKNLFILHRMKLSVWCWDTLFSYISSEKRVGDVMVATLTLSLHERFLSGCRLSFSSSASGI